MMLLREELRSLGMNLVMMTGTYVRGPSLPTTS